MQKTIVTIQYLFLATLITLFQQTYATPVRATESINEKMILHYINEYRVAHHLKPLKVNAHISKEAERHSRDMARKAAGIDHDHFNIRIKHLYGQIDGCQGGAENVAYYKVNARKLVEAWLASPGHRRNIRGNYNLTGIGIAYGKEGWAYYTQIFLRTNDSRHI